MNEITLVNEITLANEFTPANEITLANEFTLTNEITPVDEIPPMNEITPMEKITRVNEINPLDQICAQGNFVEYSTLGLILLGWPSNSTLRPGSSIHSVSRCLQDACCMPLVFPKPMSDSSFAWPVWSLL